MRQAAEHKQKTFERELRDMHKESIKTELKGYWYDYQYYLEKSKDIERLKAEIEKSYSRIESMRNKDKNIADLEEKILWILKKQAEEETVLLGLLTKKQAIESSINAIPQPYKTIIFLRYVRFLTFDEIAAKLNYSTKRIYQLHDEAIGKLSMLEEMASLPVISTN